MRPLQATFILLLFAVIELKAQGSIIGRVVDGLHQPTAYATVTLLTASDSSVVQGKITDEEGVYEMQNVAYGNYKLRITFVGYETLFSKNFIVSPEEKKIILGDHRIQEASQTLEEVTVTAQRPLIEKQPDRLVMNLENSILAKGAMANEILTMAPLVSSGMDGRINLRGKTNVMILIDGKTIPEATLSTTLQNLSAEEIEKIEIITNPPARYDAAASGGVINVITKQAKQLGFKGTYSLFASQGQYGKLYSGLSLNYRTKKLTIFSSLDYSAGKDLHQQSTTRDFQLIDRIVTNDFDNTSEYQTPSGRIGMGYQLGKNHEIGVTFDGYLSESEAYLTGNTSFQGYTARSDSVVQATNRSLDDLHVYNFSVNYQGTLNERGDYLSAIATQTLYYRDNNQALKSQTFSDEQTLIGEETIRTKLPSDIKITIAQADYSRFFSEKIKADIGVKYTGVNTSSLFSQSGTLDNTTLNTGYIEHIAAGYISVNASLLNYSLQAGLRGENTSSDIISAGQRKFFNFFPSISIQRSISDAFDVSLSYSRKIDRPLYQNLLPIRNYVDRYTVWEGNPNLKPQYSNILELTGTLNNFTLIAGYTYIKDATFEIPISDAVTQVMNVSMENIDLAEVYNLSAVLPFEINSWWQTNNSVTGIYNRAQSASHEDFEADQFSLMLNSTNVFSFYQGWKGELTGYYNSSQQNGVLNFSPLYAINVGVGRDVLAGRGSFKLRLEDIFWSQRYDGESTIGSVYQQFTNLRDTRRVRVSFTYRFGKQTIDSVEDKGLGNESEKSRLSY